MATIPFNTSGNPSVSMPVGSNDALYRAENRDKVYSDFGGDWLGYLRYMADRGNTGALDKLMQFMMNESSADIARRWTAEREDTQYQRLFADMRAAGINPMAFATLGASPISSSSSGSSYGGAYTSSYEINNRKVEQNWLKIALSSLIPIIGGLIAGAL